MLRLCHDILMRREHDTVERSRMHPDLANSSNFRSGVDVMNFLFDLINDIAGYTMKYYDETKEIIDHEGLIKKYRSEKERCAKEDIPLAESELFADKYPHCLVVIEGIHKLLEMPDSDFVHGSS